MARLIRSGRARAAVGEMLRDRYVSGRSSKRGSAALRAASDSDDSDNSATRPDVVELEERGGDDDISENHADDPAGDEDGRGDVPSVPPAVGGESWRSQRSRAVMRQLKSLSRQSSRSLKLADLERTRSLRSASSLRDGADSAPSVDRATDSGEDAAATPPTGSEPAEDEPPEDLDELEDKLTAWLQCSGLHTVDKWVLNYRKHPSCWAALLMMHGVPEVSGRLRAKVENYAIYSALFLSCTIQAAMNPPEVMNCPEREFDSDVAEWQCRVTRRVAVYALLGAIAMHFYSIILAMAFVNALNEAAREADVFRIFARGQGYLATFKCQQAFRVGAGFCMLAIAAVCLEYVGWDAVAWIAFLLTYILYNFNKTSDMLFRNGSLVNYWRTELGGKPDPDDPYSIAPAVHVFKERVKFSRGLLGDEDFVDEDAMGGEADGKLWIGKGEDRKEPKTERSSPSTIKSILRRRSEDAEGASPEAALRQHQRREKNKNKRKKGYNDHHLGTHVGSKAVSIL